jgi:hypothetical protein
LIENFREGKAIPGARSYGHDAFHGKMFEITKGVFIAEITIS